MINKNTGTIQLSDMVEGEGHNSDYHANRMIKTKYIGKGHSAIKFKTKGDAYYPKNGDQWYFRPKMKVSNDDGEKVDNEEFFRVKWQHLAENVEAGFFGYATYTGLNRALYSKNGKGLRGEVHVTEDFDFIFRIKTEDGQESFRVRFESLNFEDAKADRAPMQDVLGAKV